MAMQPLPVPTSTMRGLPCSADERERLLDDHLGFGPWDEDVRAHFEVEPPELARAQDVGDRLAPFAPRDERLVVQQKHARGFLVAIGQKARAIPAKHLPREHLGIERSRALELMPAFTKRSRAPCTRS